MIKIALIAPPYPLEEAPSPPLGVTYVAAACERAGAEVRIFDYIVRKYSPEKLAEEMAAFRPDVIGTTSVTMNYKKAASILRDAKRIDPGAITVFGGPHVSFDWTHTLSDYPETDLVIIGEGEQTLAELVPRIKDRNAWKLIRGIAFRDGNGTITKTEDRPLMENIDDLPLPSRHLLPMSRYQALGFPVSIITSRGCPNKCIFCLGRKMVGFKVRHRSTRRVVDEIEDILAYGFDFINIADDLFTANKKRVVEFCDELKRRNLKFRWSAFARVNTVDYDTLKLMKEAGCHAVSFGIESGNPDMLVRVRKGITLDQARHAVEACRKAGVTAHASFLAGLPGETLETLEDSYRFSKELDILYGFHVLAPFPGTTVRDNIGDYDLEILSDDWDLYDADNVIVKTSNVEPSDIQAFVDRATATIKKDWDELERRFRENEPLSDDEFMQIGGFHRMKMIYKILSEDLVEEHGVRKGDYEKSLCELAGIVAEKTGLKPDFTALHLEDLVKKGYIAWEENEGSVRFFWTHNNRQNVFS